MSFEISGTKEMPYHLSIGAVIEDEGKYALIKKPDGDYTLPRETIYSNESIEDTLLRGMSEELGIIMNVKNFLGSLNIKFNLSDGTEINKTTIYFFCIKVGNYQRKPENDESDDSIFWLTTEEVKKYLSECNNPELKIFERIILK